MTFTTAAVLLTWLALLVLALALAGVIRQVRVLAGGAGARVLVGPAVGTAAPPLAGGRPVPRPALVVFAEPDCPTCSDVLPALQNGLGTQLEKLVLYPGSAPPGEAGIETLSHQQEAFDGWNVVVTPFVAVVDAGGDVVAAGAVGSVPILHGIVKSAERVLERRNIAS
jgi:hypothetical protein